MPRKVPSDPKKLIIVPPAPAVPSQEETGEALVRDFLADTPGREYVDRALWWIRVPLPPPPNDVQAKKTYMRMTATPQERLARERLEREQERARAAGWEADPAAAETQVTMDVRVVEGRVELHEPDGISDGLNRRAWDRIQKRYQQPIGLRLDEGKPVVTFRDGRSIPEQHSEKYGTSSQLSSTDLITSLEQCTYRPRLSDDQLDRLRAHVEAGKTVPTRQLSAVKREQLRKLQEILNYNDELRRTETGDGRGKQNAVEAPPLSPARHSPDFRSVHWHGNDYTFTPTQATCVKILWDAMEKRTPDVGDHHLLTEASSDTRRIVDLFRNHPAWGKMIVVGATKGTRRLANPPPP